MIEAVKVILRAIKFGVSTLAFLLVQVPLTALSVVSLVCLLFTTTPLEASFFRALFSTETPPDTLRSQLLSELVSDQSPIYTKLVSIPFLPDWLLLVTMYLPSGLLVAYFYVFDKRQAFAGNWRVPEKDLHFLESIGGWPVAFIAQRLVRHKTQKVEYQTTFWLIGFFHIALFLGVVFVAPSWYWFGATIFLGALALRSIRAKSGTKKTAVSR